MSTDPNHATDEFRAAVLQEVMEEFGPIRKLIPLMRWVLGGIVSLLLGASGIGAWVALHDYQLREVKTATDKHDIKLADHDEHLNRFYVWQSATDANRFTSKEAAELQRILTEAHSNHDRRIQRVEDGQVTIEKSLSRIESALGTKSGGE